MGIDIISTSQGIMTDREAQETVKLVKGLPDIYFEDELLNYVDGCLCVPKYLESSRIWNLRSALMCEFYSIGGQLEFMKCYVYSLY